MRLAVSVFSHNADDILDIVMSNIEQEAILCIDSSYIDIILKFTSIGMTLAPSERGSVYTLLQLYPP